MRAALPLVVLAALALPVLGEPQPRLELTYEAVTVAGAWQGFGQLQAFELAPTKSMAAPSTLHLEAPELRVHAMHDATVYVPGGVVVNEPAAVDSARFLDAVVEAHHLAPDFYLAVVPRPHLERPRVLVQGDCTQVEPAPSDPWTPFAYATPRDWLDVTSIIEQAFDWSECGQIRSVRLEGHFILTHWKWQHNVTGKDEDGRAATQTVKSGFEAAEQGSVLGTSTQVYLVVTDGILDVTVGEPKMPLLFLGQSALSGENLRLRGDVLHAAPLDTRATPPADDFTAKGLNQLAFAWQDDSKFDVQLTGDAAPSSTQPSSRAVHVVDHAGWFVWVTVGWVIAILAFAAWQPWLRPWTLPADVLDHANQRFHRGRYYRAAWIARYAAWRGARRGPAYETIAHARGGLGQTERALRWFSRADRHYTDPKDIARVNYSASLVAARGDLASEAADRLFRAASLVPEYLNQARTAPEFASVEDHAAFQAVLQHRFLGGQDGVVHA